MSRGHIELLLNRAARTSSFDSWKDIERRLIKSAQNPGAIPAVEYLFSRLSMEQSLDWHWAEAFDLLLNGRVATEETMGS